MDVEFIDSLLIAHNGTGTSTADNFSSTPENTPHSGPPPYSFARIIEIYTMPFICTFGLIGNCLATLTFLQKSMRNTSCSLYLAARAICDNIFLASLAIIWIGQTINVEMNRIPALCQIIGFLTFICSCVSIWLVVFVTVENYIRICHHGLVKRFCTTHIARLLIAGLCVTALTLYHFPLWISNSDCSPSLSHFTVTQVFIYIDSSLTIAIPSITMVTLNIVIIFNLIKSFNRRARLKRLSVTSHRIRNPMAKVTKMLLAVSIVFISLNLPSHVIRIRLLINSFVKGSTEASEIEYAIQSVSHLVYYISLVINICIYYIFGKKFRTVFQQTFCGKQTHGREHGRPQVIPLSERSNKQSLTVLLNSEEESQYSLHNGNGISAVSVQEKV